MGGARRERIAAGRVERVFAHLLRHAVAKQCVRQT